MNTNFDLGDDDKIRFFARTDEYRQLLEYMIALYEEELVDQTIFSSEWGQFTAAAKEEKYTIYTFYDPGDFYDVEIGESWTSMSALKGPNGDQIYTKTSSSIWVQEHLYSYLLTRTRQLLCVGWITSIEISGAAGVLAYTTDGDSPINRVEDVLAKPFQRVQRALSACT